MKDPKLAQSTRLVIKHYWAEVMQNKLHAFLGIILPGVGTTFTTYVPPLIVAALITRFEQTGVDLQVAVPYIWMFIGAWVLGELIWRWSFYHIIIFEGQAIHNLYVNAMGYLMQKDQAFFNDNFAGSLTKRSLAYAKSFEGVVDTVSFSIIANVFPLVFIVPILWKFSPYLVLVLLGMVTAAIFVIRPLIKKRTKMVDAREESSNKLSGHVADMIANMSIIHTFAREADETKWHKTHVDDLIKKTKRTWNYHNTRIDMATLPFLIITNALGLILAISIGGSNFTEVAAIFVTFSYFANFTHVLWEFNQIYRRLESGVTEAAQFTELLLEEPKVQDPVQPEQAHIKDGGILFDNVTFQYVDNRKDTPLLEGFNLQIQPGEKIGLVGHSGGGKTTITRLLLRFMDIQDGSIMIDGQDIRDVTQSDLRSHIAYVPQEPLLFHRSLRDNIAYGKPDATETEIRKIAKLAHAEEFINDLPHGYETLVGERGVKLSGGQRQRVAIARAMLKDSPILLLDEATSALDSESEVLIQDALWKLMEGRTAIVVAHRLSTIQRMDRIIVLDKGQIVEEGSHKELLKLNGIYAKLWKHQSGGFLED